MSAISRIRERLDRYPQLEVSEGRGWIELQPPGSDAFPVSMHEQDGSFSVHFAGWHEEVETEEEALNLFAMGLSDSVRLKVVTRGKMDHSWTLEVREAEAWVEESTTGLLLVPFWRPKQVRYLQNAVITGTTPAEERTD